MGEGSIQVISIDGVFKKVPEYGDRYKFFMGDEIAKVIGTGISTETGKEEVFYISEYDGGQYISPIGFFLRKVNKEKFPNAKQEYNFEAIKEDE